jgi:hypothetical protein
MSLSTNKILLANASTNTAGAYFQVVSFNVTANTTQANTTIPAGLWFVTNTANVTIYFNTSNNVASPTFTTALANNTAGLVFSDGVNVLANSALGNVTINLYGSNGGSAVSGTYNAS